MTMHLASTPANFTRPLRLPDWRGVPLLVILTAALPAMAMAQDAPAAAPGNETPTSIARLLAGRKAFAELTAKGKVKRDIKMDDQTYPMADGPSRVVLLKLPEYQEPYALTIKSYQFKHWFSTTFGIFVPTTVVLDGDFAVRTAIEGAQWPLRVLPLPASVPCGEREQSDARRCFRRRARPPAADAWLHAPGEGPDPPRLGAAARRSQRADDGARPPGQGNPAEARPARRSVPLLRVDRSHQLRPSTRQAARRTDARQDRATTPKQSTNSTYRASWRSQNAFCRAHQTCGCRPLSTTSSDCSSCSSRKESRTTEIDSIEPPQRHHFSTTWRRPRVRMKRW
jgi:hypothetical protein